MPSTVILDDSKVVHIAPALPVVEAALPVVEVAAEIVEVEAVPTSPVTMGERCRRYSVDMHAYTTIQNDIAKKAVAKRGPLPTADSDDSLKSAFSSDSEGHSPFPITKA